jgi:hypothetical protein
VFASILVGLSLALTHITHALSGDGSPPLARRLCGHGYAFCLTLLAPIVAAYCATSISQSSSGRFVAVTLFLVNAFVAGFAFYHVAFNFPRRRSRPRTQLLSRWNEERTERERQGRGRSARQQLLELDEKRRRGLLALPGAESDGGSDDDDGSENAGDAAPQEENVPDANVEQNSDEDEADEAVWAAQDAANKAPGHGGTGRRSSTSNAGGELADGGKDQPVDQRRRRTKRQRKRQRHWSVWHALRFTPTLYAFFFEARDYRWLRVRLYFFIDFAIAVVIGIVSGTLPGEGNCGGVTLLNALLALALFLYHLVVRPFRHPVSTGLGMLMTAGMAALAVTAYFATINTALIDVAVQVAVVVASVLVANVALVGLSATHRFFKRQRASDEHIASDEDSEEIEAQRHTDAQHRAALEALIRGVQADDKANPLLSHERRVVASDEITADTVLYTGREHLFGRSVQAPPPPGFEDESHGDIPNEPPDERRRRMRLRYPHYLERPLQTHDDSATRFVQSLAARRPVRSLMDEVSPVRVVIGGHLGVLGSESRPRPPSAPDAPQPPPLSPLLLIDRANQYRRGAERPRPITDADFEELDALAETQLERRDVKQKTAQGKGLLAKLRGKKNDDDGTTTMKK